MEKKYKENRKREGVKEKEGKWIPKGKGDKAGPRRC